MSRKSSTTRQNRTRNKEVKEYDAIIRYASTIVLLAAGVLLLLAIFGAAGPIGDVVFAMSYTIVGIGAFFLPLALIAVGLYAGFGRPTIEPLTATGTVLITASVLAFAGLFPGAKFGGETGTWFGMTLSSFFGFWGTLVLLVAVVAIGVAIVTDIEMLVALMSENVSALWKRIRKSRSEKDEDEEFSDVVGIPEDAEDEEVPTEAVGMMPEHEPVITIFNRTTGASGSGIVNFDGEYDAPPLSLLGTDKGKPSTGDIKANANIIKRTFQNFGINLEMDEVSVGPTVTRYAVKPAEGVRLSKIVSLANNLELALAAHPVRIEAPIPGKSLVGIEVPNTVKAMVGLGGLLSSPEWSDSEKPLLAALGRDIKIGRAHV